MSCQITFLPERKSVSVLPGTPVSVAAGVAGIVLTSPCGGRGTCGKCRIRRVSGKIEGEPVDPDIYLACQSRVRGDAVDEAGSHPVLLQPRSHLT